MNFLINVKSVGTFIKKKKKKNEKIKYVRLSIGLGSYNYC